MELPLAAGRYPMQPVMYRIPDGQQPKVVKSTDDLVAWVGPRGGNEIVVK